MPRILVISDHDDVHVAPVAAHLDAGFEVTTIDPMRVVHGEDLSFETTRRGSRVLYRGEVLEDVTGVWYRKPTVLAEADIPVAGEYRRYALSSIEQHARCLNVQFGDAVWVSDVFAINRARPKAGQLAAAANAGFAVPETLITSSPALARSFVRGHGRCVVKPLAVRFPPGSARYATVVDATDPLDYPGIGVDPQILQAYVEPARELRVTVVGREVFAAEIRAGAAVVSDGGLRVRDWRAAIGTPGFGVVEAALPAELADRCRRYLTAFGLRFGAFDVIVDRAGVFWFLECNANGQWLFVEDATGQPIAGAMARLLSGG